MTTQTTERLCSRCHEQMTAEGICDECVDRLAAEHEDRERELANESVRASYEAQEEAAAHPAPEGGQGGG